MWRTTAVTFCSYSSTMSVIPSSAKRCPQAHWPEYRTGLLRLRAACWREGVGRVLTGQPVCHKLGENQHPNPSTKKFVLTCGPSFPQTVDCACDFRNGVFGVGIGFLKSAQDEQAAQ